MHTNPSHNCSDLSTALKLTDFLTAYFAGEVGVDANEVGADVPAIAGTGSASRFCRRVTARLGAQAPYQFQGHYYRHTRQC